jgi:3-deoxy-D-manno-octulosonic-acid transferase
VRSIRRYIKLRAFFREVLKNFDAFSMVSEEDAARIRSLGADHQKVEVNGNAKYDLLVVSADPRIEEEMLEILNLGTSPRVLVAGSTRQGEETMILDAYGKILKKFPDMILIIAPRHIERTPEIVSLVQGRNLTCHLRSELNKGRVKRTGQVIILDTFGELFKVYSIATMVFCGASLVPLGGQNPLEPAAWGKVTFYGPSMEDFLDAKELLETAGAGIEVLSPGMLSEKAIWFLEHPDELRRCGTRARSAVLGNLGAAEKHAGVVKRLLVESNRVQP